ncbi:FAD/NAD(P)-binding protein [Candidatus Phycosocius spiralis]|uniref:FAD/NAD(P)-binding protein n=1 Tax=Candidatus Phycosocius spiralis TaxID=2815099 RepID=UPI0024E09C8E|nr:FAD/NAD(P)-binding protein [Candidatus Phycosocius spiralis]
MPVHDLLIIGGGFGACSALAWLARLAPKAMRVAVMIGSRTPADGADNFYGCGLAYGAQDPTHLLNSAHWNMGLLLDEPDGFTHWLSAQSPTKKLSDFVPRAEYGAFLQSKWHENLKLLTLKGVEVHVIQQSAISILELTDRFVTIVDDAGTNHSCAAVLVCMGPTLISETGLRHEKLISPIWPHGLQCLKGACGQVVIIGTGLSGIDAAISALAEPEVTKLTMISRDGRLPLAHDAAARERLDVQFKGCPLEVLKTIRTAASRVPWQAVMNALRDQSNIIWHDWTTIERRLALRHLSGMWTAHRNRLPPDVLRQVETAIDHGRLEIIKSFTRLHFDNDGHVCVQLIGSGGIIKPDWVVDARGFARINMNMNSFFGQALRDGHFNTSGLGYGIAGDKSHRVTPLGLAPIHVVGAARIGDLIETTGAPEVRTQVHQSLEALLKPNHPVKVSRHMNCQENGSSAID